MFIPCLRGGATCQVLGAEAGASHDLLGMSEGGASAFHGSDSGAPRPLRVTCVLRPLVEVVALATLPPAQGDVLMTHTGGSL